MDKKNPITDYFSDPGTQFLKVSSKISTCRGY